MRLRTQAIIAAALCGSLLAELTIFEPNATNAFPAVPQARTKVHPVNLHALPKRPAPAKPVLRDYPRVRASVFVPEPRRLAPLHARRGRDPLSDRLFRA